MTEEQIREGNKLIAEFDGWHHVETPKNKGKGHWNKPAGPYAHWDLSSMKYHSSWDWLMPVVEKIENMRDEIIDKVYVSINGTECGLWNYFDVKDILREKGEPGVLRVKNSDKTKIIATWRTVTDFIKWYNSQNKKHKP